MDMKLADKVVFITGASGGIGRALAEAFAAEGALLALHGRSHFEDLERYVGEQPWAARARCVRADVSSASEMTTALRRAAEAFSRVDVCIANAGLWPRPAQPLHEIPEERVRATLDANLFGAIFTARAFLGELQRSGPRADGHGASLVFIGSTAGRFGERGHSDYAVAKAGLYGLVRTLKNEIVHVDPYGRVNMIEPGWTVTHMVRKELQVPGVIAKVTSTMPLRQLARAADVARAAVFLSSPATARQISGEVLTIAGGMEGRVQWSPAEVDEDAVRNRLRQD